jgi:16S rRNA (guanine966-N2)-methyltransferase
MRVIGGEARGRRLRAPVGLVVRPTADRVRQTVFDLLAFRWSGGRVLDVFAGSGALGIEALSRGADAAVFLEKDPAALAALTANLEVCRFTDRAVVRRGESRLGLKTLAGKGERFSLVFVDPPYAATGLRDEILTLLPPLLVSGAYIVVETSSAETSPAALPEWELITERRFGRTQVYLYCYV